MPDSPRLSTLRKATLPALALTGALAWVQPLAASPGKLMGEFAYSLIDGVRLNNAREVSATFNLETPTRVHMLGFMNFIETDGTMKPGSDKESSLRQTARLHKSYNDARVDLDKLSAVSGAGAKQVTFFMRVNRIAGPLEAIGRTYTFSCNTDPQTAREFLAFFVNDGLKFNIDGKSQALNLAPPSGKGSNAHSSGSAAAGSAAAPAAPAASSKPAPPGGPSEDGVKKK